MQPHEIEKYLKPLKPAAVILCGKRGLDPEERMPSFNGELFAPANWMMAAQELLQLSQCLTSLKEAAEQAPTIPVIVQ